MNDIFVSRLNAVLEESEMSKYRFCKESSISLATLYHYLKGEYKPKQDTLRRMSNTLHVSSEWLIGESDVKRPSPKIDNEYAMLENIRSTYGQDAAECLMHFISLKDSDRFRILGRMEEMLHPGRITQSNIRTLPYYRNVSAGTGAYIYDDVCDYIQVPDNEISKNAAYALRVSGNSMEPEYHNGDILLVEVCCSIHIGEVGIFNINNEGYVKKLGNGVLISLNENYKDIPLTDESRCMGRVLGKVDFS